MPWNIENYYILNGRVLNVEITVPLMDFLYVNIDDVKQAWFEMLSQFVKEEPGLEMSWEIEPRENDALITIRIAKSGELEEFTKDEIEDAISATDALIAEEEKKPKKGKSKTKTRKSKK
ncbi:MAG: hypothetical protein K9W43_06150 [Candidatus Thorarchaeota archaeon]|nr:hypothetical protein [Candidatus Thorarchaeota archaeon]